jgi:hypothetical protein
MRVDFGICNVRKIVAKYVSVYYVKFIAATLIVGQRRLCRSCCCPGCADSLQQVAAAPSSTPPLQLRRKSQTKSSLRRTSRTVKLQSRKRQGTHQARLEHEVGKIHEFSSGAGEQLHALQLRLVELRHVSL